MSTIIADIKIPDSKLAIGAAELLREHGNDLLWNHSHRVFLFGVLQGQKAAVKFDPELLYISALFHDLGLTKHYSSADKRFEVDGANAARSYLQQHGVPDDSIRLVWDAIAFHTTIGIAQYKEPEVALIYSGVGYDVMGENFDSITEEVREKVVSAFPRNNLKIRYCQHSSKASNINQKRHLVI